MTGNNIHDGIVLLIVISISIIIINHSSNYLPSQTADAVPVCFPTDGVPPNEAAEGRKWIIHVCFLWSSHSRANGQHEAWLKGTFRGTSLDDHLERSHSMLLQSLWSMFLSFECVTLMHEREIKSVSIRWWIKHIIIDKINDNNQMNRYVCINELFIELNWGSSPFVHQNDCIIRSEMDRDLFADSGSWTFALSDNMQIS